MKKKNVTKSKNESDWITFTEHLNNIQPKETDLIKSNIKKNNFRKLDLHGTSLNKSNVIVKEFVVDSYNNDYRKLLIITGKGLRSKTQDNPYISEKLGVLRYSVPEFIKNDDYLKNKISKISQAGKEDGGEGAIYVFLKKKDNL